MFIYNGKLNWGKRYAVNECYTVIFPTAFALNDLVAVFWQWSVEDKGVFKRNITRRGKIHTVSNKDGEYRFSATLGKGWFRIHGVVAADLKKVTLTMESDRGSSNSPLNLKQQQTHPGRAPSMAVYSGKLNHGQSLRDEMFTLIIPYGVSDGDPVGLYFQWTEDKRNHLVNTKFRNTSSSDDYFRGWFDDGSYTYGMAIQKKERKAFVYISDGILVFPNLPVRSRLENGAQGEGTLTFSLDEGEEFGDVDSD